ncbi:endonuclease NucS domain-containing protein [Thalassoglobus sp.]|uniref:endonuclease NucS domain-containing protein n=1 Tax=Thalassoglobus sp. TaxID=2795869 RepID=UPI003AA87A32
MSKIWVIAPFDSRWPEEWEQVWEFDKANGLISIGFNDLNDVHSYSIEQLKELMDNHSAHTLYKFYNEIHEGDTIVARYGTCELAGIGTVTREAYHDPLKTAELFHSLDVGYNFTHHIDVEWDTTQEWWAWELPQFGMQTLHSITSEKLKMLLEQEVTDDSEEEEWVEELPPPKIEIVLEKYLEDFIISNFQQIFGPDFKLYEDSNGSLIGQQYSTGEVGVIDVLCEDTKSNELVVIELKKGRPADKVVGQTLRYMGWVAENLCKNGQTVSGLIICKESDPKLKFALKMVPNIAVKYFHVDFELSDDPFRKV